ncbi:hypothetical protein G6F50_012573 [Rhizopus delemar]|uniref:Uncharacterized protein n=1 Tax=Rhizopus delemar TaxID=936053 RepID=A0A9P6YQU8_9FUNG|nr:hypothetical protein G6F50_012573 [Rhizopus delemar]
MAARPRCAGVDAACLVAAAGASTVGVAAAAGRGRTRPRWAGTACVEPGAAAACTGGTAWAPGGAVHAVLRGGQRHRCGGRTVGAGPAWLGRGVPAGGGHRSAGTAVVGMWGIPRHAPAERHARPALTLPLQCAPPRRLLQRRAGHHHAVAAAALGLVHRGVGARHQPLVIRVAVMAGHADAGGQCQYQAIGQGHRRLCDLPAQAFGNHFGLRFAGRDQHHHEFFAAIAEQIIAAAGELAEQARHVLQRAVAGIMAVAVVDGLEMIQIEQQQRERRVVARGQLDLPAQYRRQETAVEQVGQGGAAGIQFADALEQQCHQRADGCQVFADQWQPGQPLGSGVGGGLLQAIIDTRHQLPDLLGLAAFTEAGDALVGEPQAELGAGQAGTVAALHMAGQGVQQGVLPIQQQGALTLALGADVLRQREQPVGRIGTGGAFARMGVSQGHAFHGDVHDRAEAVDGGEGGGTVGRSVAQAHEQLVLEHARATGHQVDGNADPRVHIADHPLRGEGGGDAGGIGGQQLHQPALHGRLQALLDLLMGQETACPCILQQHFVEALGQRGRGIGGSGAQQRGGGRAGLLQAMLPRLGQRLAGIVQLG